MATYRIPNTENKELTEIKAKCLTEAVDLAKNSGVNVCHKTLSQMKEKEIVVEYDQIHTICDAFIKGLHEDDD